MRTAGLDVFACHLAAAPQDGLHRQAQVLEIDRSCPRGPRRPRRACRPGSGRTRPAMPAILCGDFNAEPDSDEIRFLSSLTALDGRTTFWQDAWRVAGDGPGLTQDWRTNPIAAAMNVHRKRIDYVFVGDPFLRDGERRAGARRGGRVRRAAHRGAGQRPRRAGGRHQVAGAAADRRRTRVRSQSAPMPANRTTPTSPAMR